MDLSHCERLVEQALGRMDDQGRDHNIDDSLMCSICLDILHDPHILKGSGHTFCKKCILTSLRIKTECPKTRISIPHRRGESLEELLSPNYCVRAILQSQRIPCCFAGCGKLLKLEEIILHEARCEHRGRVTAKPGRTSSRQVCGLQGEGNGTHTNVLVQHPDLDSAERLAALEAYLDSAERLAVTKDREFVALEAKNALLVAALAANGFGALVARLSDFPSNIDSGNAEEATVPAASGPGQALAGFILKGIRGTHRRMKAAQRRCNGYYVRAAALEICNGDPVWVHANGTHYVYRDAAGSWVATISRAHFATNMGLVKSSTFCDLSPADVAGWDIHDGVAWVPSPPITSTAMTRKQASWVAASRSSPPTPSRCAVQ